MTLRSSGPYRGHEPCPCCAEPLLPLLGEPPAPARPGTSQGSPSPSSRSLRPPLLRSAEDALALQEQLVDRVLDRLAHLVGQVEDQHGVLRRGGPVGRRLDRL